LLFDPEMAASVEEVRKAVPSLAWVVALDEVLVGQSDRPTAWPDVIEDPRAEAALGFTGGTTGRPKGVVISHRNFEALVLGIIAAADLGDPPVYLAAAPITHAAGALCFPVLALGGSIIVQRSVAASEILDAIEHQSVTFLYLPPTAIYVLLSHHTARARRYSSLRSFVYGAAPMAAERVREAIEVFGPVMVQMFGQTEAMMICTVLTAVEHSWAVAAGDLDRLASAGRPSLVARVAVMSDDGALLERGQVGEIVVRGNLVMEGYLDDPEANAQVSAHGWHHTGDVGFVDDTGFVHLVDRKKDMIITGGFNVFSSEVEQVVLAHPAVLQCAVIGTPDERWGEAVTAIVELRAGSVVTAEEIIASCKAALGSVKSPKRVEFWPELPRSPVGKVLKREIRSTFWAGRDRAI
jgi:acyl-CoA synthetase (AMP-forming)/AMP-acid ligase II